MKSKHKKRQNVISTIEVTFTPKDKCKGCKCKPNEFCEVHPKLAKFCKII